MTTGIRFEYSTSRELSGREIRKGLKYTEISCYFIFEQLTCCQYFTYFQTHEQQLRR